jgi:short-chain Z-isoprenyl diphosphate synthase
MVKNIHGLPRAKTHIANRAVQRKANVLSRLSIPELLKRPFYEIYNRRLQTKLNAGPIPEHIGLVLDGNRRWALLTSSESHVGHQTGAERVDDLLRWCDELEIPVVTIWVLSIDNLGREERELDNLIDVFEKGLSRLAALQPELRRPRRFQAVGRLDLLPPSLLEAIAQAQRNTSSYGPSILNIAIGYGGREEIIDAIKKLIQHNMVNGRTLDHVLEELSPETLGKYTYFNGLPDPDLIIRTSGEVRLSGFMLWQSVHSEFYFCDALWPAFRKVDFLRAIRSFQERKRRFGR